MRHRTQLDSSEQHHDLCPLHRQHRTKAARRTPLQERTAADARGARISEEIEVDIALRLNSHFVFNLIPLISNFHSFSAVRRGAELSFKITFHICMVK